MEHKFKKSNAEVRTIKGIQFGVISPDFIKNISVTQSMEFAGKEISKGINHDMCYDPGTGQPNLGAINDPRMGSTDYDHCGYFGHIELVRPVYHIGFLKIVIDILRSVSYYTSELLVPREDYVNKRGRRNLKEITHLAKGIKKCPITQKKLPIYTKEGPKIAIDFGKGKEIINPSEVYSILEKISDEDAMIMGINPQFTRPEWLLLTTIPVPPPHVRPSVFMSSSQKCDDDLTTKLNEIVKTNIALTKAIEKSNQDQGTTNEHFISQLESLLQYNVSTFIDNQHPGQPPSLQRSGKPLKTLRERLSGKDGRVRGNLMGKRVDFSARTVITADPNLSIDQVGVPKTIAINLTIPEIVTDYNKDYLMELVKRGPNVHPGAKFIIKNGGVRLDLKYANITELKNGWVVERHLSDGDAVLFNRQPSLHKMSIMGHKVKVLEGSTFRLNLACTSPYNADFDGDEMNLHVPQSLTARAEVEQLMMVDKLIVSPQANKPVIGIIQDSLLSSCKMTRRDVFVKKEHLMNIIMLIHGWDHNIPKPAVIKNGVEYWTGKQVFSLIIPSTVNIDNVKDRMNPRDQGIMIRKGIILSGSIDKSVIGKSQGGLVHILFNDFGSGTTKVFLNQVQKLSNYWIKQHGFTMGVGDAIASPETIEQVKQILKSTKEKIKLVIEDGVNGDKNPKVVEEYINIELNAAVSEAGKKAEESLTFDNNFKATVSSGSKGSNINISQILSCVGQQNIEGRRINYGFKHRTLPHFDKFDVSPESRGFVENSYLKGLTPQEFFFHAQAGREGIIDTACKTSETGYIQRRLVKALEDVSIKYDYTVRNSRGLIVQFLYGEDGIDATYMENIHIKLLGYSNDELYDIYYNKDLPEEYELIKQLQCELIEIARLRELNNVKQDDDYFPMPVNLNRVITYARSLKSPNKEYFTDKQIYDEVRGLSQRITDMFIPSKDPIIGSERVRSLNASKIFRIYMWSELATNKIKDLVKTQILYIIEEIELKFKKAIAHPGEMCGILAAQSIGEPATQMSAIGSTQIIVQKPDGNIFKGSISELIDPLCKSSGDMISEVVDVTNYKIIGVDSVTEKTSWNEISQISRHPANGGMVKVRTRSGKVTTATLSHSFLKRSEKGIVPILGSNLKLGDRIPVAKFIPVVSEPLTEFEGFKLTKDLGWFIGSYISDGNINYHEITISKIIPEFSNKVIEFAESINCKARYKEKEQRHNTFGKEGKTIFTDKKLAIFLKQYFGEGSEYKHVGAFVYASNIEFISGIISGYFDGDGNVNCIPGKQMIRSSSISEQLTIDMITLLSYFGIFASKCIERNRYHTIQISRKYARMFKEKIGLVVIDKLEALDKVIEYVERQGAHSSQEMIDKIPEIGNLLATIRDKLKLPVRIYGRYKNKESIGRSTLVKYIGEFEQNPRVSEIKEELEKLKMAANSDVVWDEITSLEILEDPKEYVYDFTVPGNQSFMVDCNILIHNTLNSVEYNTNLIIDWTGQEKPPVRPNEKIGLFIDSLIGKYPDKCQLQPDGHTIYLPLEKGTAKAMSTDEDGNIIWTELEAVTRHPPINKDGSNTLVKITTESGREAIATKAKSFLVYQNGKIVDKEGSELKVGDLIPIVGKSTAQEFRTHIDLKNILDPRKVVFTDYMIQAKNIMLIANKTGPKTEWFKFIKDKVPYDRSDTLRVAIEKAMIANGEAEKAKLMFVPGKVYPKTWGKFADKKVNGVPSNIELDREFGFLIGAYLAEGCITDFQVRIANNNENYRKMATAWSDRQNISNRLNISNCGGPELNGGKEMTSTSICIHSTILRHLLVEICGKGSYEKRVPEFAYSAPDSFVEGLLDAYICGDGSVDKRCGRMTASSRSKTLRDGISLLLNRLSILTKLSESTRLNKKDINDPDGIEKPLYHVYTYANDARRLSKFITAIDYKIKGLIDNIKEKTEYECVCGKCVDTEKSLSRHQKKYCKIKNNLNDTIFDPIISIEDYVSEHPFVYDLTVEKTRNMTIVNGIHQKDTFHLIQRWEKYPVENCFSKKQLR